MKNTERTNANSDFLKVIEEQEAENQNQEKIDNAWNESYINILKILMAHSEYGNDACIITKDNKIVSSGINTINNSTSLLSITKDVDSPKVSAIINAIFDVKGCTRDSMIKVYTTKEPNESEIAIIAKLSDNLRLVIVEV